MNGKAKGDKFENDVCRALSIWLIDGDWQNAKVYELPFRRRFTDTTPMEGHWEGQGDILHKPGIHFPFCVECKKIEAWELDGMFGNEKWKPWAWWGQCKEQADKVKKVPFMFFTRNRRSVYCLMEREIGGCLNVRPVHAPVVELERQTGEVLLLAKLEDVLATPRGNVKEIP